MTYKLTNRKTLKSSEWLAAAAASGSRDLQPPPRVELKLQEIDLAAHVNAALAIQHVKDEHERVIEKLGDTPTRDERVGSDGAIAVSIHKAFDGLTLREASDPDFWAYLTCFGCPQYTRWRWDTTKPAALWSRFAGNTRRNALSRLWWWAEITCDHSRPLEDQHRYDVTRQVKGRQTLMLWFVDCAFSGNALVTRFLAGVQSVHSLDDPAQAAICRTVNRLARVVCLDSIVSPHESEALCERALAVSRLLNS